MGDSSLESQVELTDRCDGALSCRAVNNLLGKNFN